jgi:predicted nucleic acid-binding protein
MLVVDASVAFSAARVDGGFSELRDADLVGPGLMWSEARAALHEVMWRGDLSRANAEAAMERLEAAPVDRQDPPNLGAESWRIADELGWAKTYDAEYVALASLLDCRLVTLDGRLWRGTRRLGFVVSPAEL